MNHPERIVLCLIEDDKNDAFLTQRRFRQHNIRCLIVDSCELALKFIPSNQSDIDKILLDIKFGENQMGAVEFIDKLQEICPSHPPVTIFTGHAQSCEACKLREKHLDIVQKPSDWNDFDVVIDQILKRSKKKTLGDLVR